MNNEPHKPIPAQELTEKELEGVNGGVSQSYKFKLESDKTKLEYKGYAATTSRYIPMF